MNSGQSCRETGQIAAVVFLKLIIPNEHLETNKLKKHARLGNVCKIVASEKPEGIYTYIYIQ